MLAAKADPSLLAPQVQAETAAWEKQISEAAVRWQILDPHAFTSSDGATLAKQPDHSILAGGTRPEKDTYTIGCRLGPGDQGSPGLCGWKCWRMTGCP